MIAPAEHDLLRTWEEAVPQHPLDRALTLLRAACPDHAHAELGRMSVGTRDSLLLSLRERLFGRALRAVADCAECGETLDLALTTTGLRAAPALEGPPREPVEHELELDGVMIRFRLVDSFDLAAALSCDGVAAARRALLDRVVVAAHRAREPVRELSPAVEARLEERLAELDPQADIALDLTCPSCSARWQAPFDVFSFLWSDIDRWARRLFRTVDALARAYGWSEADVLALSPHRRRIYQELAAGGDA
ncbi:MAG TPA: hypothetical protein VFK02_14095 [Kofleriaceae bacterium]|nr:hypothetical protein [Kofleriaceae bacterium]